MRGRGRKLRVVYFPPSGTTAQIRRRRGIVRRGMGERRQLLNASVVQNYVYLERMWDHKLGTRKTNKSTERALRPSLRVPVGVS